MRVFEKARRGFPPNSFFTSPPRNLESMSPGCGRIALVGRAQPVAALARWLRPRHPRLDMLELAADRAESRGGRLRKETGSTFPP